MIKISKDDEQILVSLEDEDKSRLGGLTSLLELFNAKYDKTGNNIEVNWRSAQWPLQKILSSLKKLCIRDKIDISFDQYTNDIVNKIESNARAKDLAIQAGLEIKTHNEQDSKLELPDEFKRTLLPYQKLPAEHLFTVGNGANFSVPGSGKTTIALASYSMMKHNKQVDKILVICPRSAFMAWEEEFEKCFERLPNTVRLCGDNILDNHNNVDILLSTYQLMSYRQAEFEELLQNHKILMILDESHNIKNGKKYNTTSWSIVARELAPYAARRMVLTGTPCPQALGDLWAQYEFLWPDTNILGSYQHFNDYTKVHDSLGQYHETIEGLYTRISKEDLNLPPVHFEEIDVPMDPLQTKIYNAIEAKAIEELTNESAVESAKMAGFRGDRGGKIIRMIQAASNPELLTKRDAEFELNSTKSLIDEETSELIENYHKYGHIPHKLMEVCKKAAEIAASGEKVVIFCSFLWNIKTMQEQLLKHNVSEGEVLKIDGSIPKDDEEDKQYNREKVIKAFKEDPNYKILIATPPSCSESVSLHINSMGETVCKHAIYFDRTFNAGHFMQSKDRIHRIGMKDDTEVTYWIFRSAHAAEDGSELETCYIDDWTHNRLNGKEERMLRALGDEITTFDLNTTHRDISNDEVASDYADFTNYLKGKGRI